MSAASDWVDELNEAIRSFGKSRSTTPVVVVHLTGERFAACRATPGPGASFVTFDVYPDAEPGAAVLAAMVRDSDDKYHTARVVIVALHEVRKVEILLESPKRSESFGFRAADA